MRRALIAFVLWPYIARQRGAQSATQLVGRSPPCGARAFQRPTRFTATFASTTTAGCATTHASARRSSAISRRRTPTRQRRPRRSSPCAKSCMRNSSAISRPISRCRNRTAPISTTHARSKESSIRSSRGSENTTDAKSRIPRPNERANGQVLRDGATEISPDHRLLAVLEDRNGSEHFVLRVKDIATDKWLPDSAARDDLRRRVGE